MQKPLPRDTLSQYNLTGCYSKGAGVVKDYKRAFELYHKAAENGLLNAEFKLSVFYYHGFGVEVDVSKAIEICQQAAEKGDMRAQYNLGVFYRNGDNIEKDIPYTTVNPYHSDSR